MKDEKIPINAEETELTKAQVADEALRLVRIAAIIFIGSCTVIRPILDYETSCYVSKFVIPAKALVTTVLIIMSLGGNTEKSSETILN
jgi:hypothetical protein